MPICGSCNKEFPQHVEIDGKRRNLQRRKYCFECSPFGSGNTRNLSRYKNMTEDEILEDQKRRQLEKVVRCQKKMRRQRKQKLADMLGGKCIKCGYNKCLKCLSFHHKDTQNKKFGICDNLLGRWADLVDEVKKCDLLCVRCHGEEHSQGV